MRVRFLTNIGKLDAKKYGIPAAKDGETHEVPDALAELLLKKGWAGVAESSPARLHGVPPAPEVTTSGDKGPSSTPLTSPPKASKNA